MEVDSHRPEGNQEEDETDDGPSTPQPLEEEDATTTDEDPKPPPIERLEGKAPSVPSPRRELPFIRRGQRGNQAQAQPHREEKAAEDTSGETDDDEL